MVGFRVTVRLGLLRGVKYSRQYPAYAFSGIGALFTSRSPTVGGDGAMKRLRVDDLPSRQLAHSFVI